MALPCYPIIEPTGGALRILRRAVRIKATAAPTAAHVPGAAPTGLGRHAAGHHTLLRRAAHAGHTPHAGTAAHSAAVPAGCAPVAGALPAGPGAQPGLSGTVPLRRATRLLGAGAGTEAGIGAGLAGSSAGILGVLVTGALLAGAGLGSTALYLSDTGAYNTSIGAPAVAAPFTLPNLVRVGSRVVPGSTLSSVATGMPGSTAAPGGSAGTPNEQPGGGTEQPVAGPDDLSVLPTAPLADTAAAGPVAVPEPASLLTFLLGGAGAILARRGLFRTRPGPSRSPR